MNPQYYVSSKQLRACIPGTLLVCESHARPLLSCHCIGAAAAHCTAHEVFTRIESPLFRAPCDAAAVRSGQSHGPAARTHTAYPGNGHDTSDWGQVGVAAATTSHVPKPGCPSTASSDSSNHTCPSSSLCALSLDAAVGSDDVLLLKIDVEGFEANVISGAQC